MKEKKKNDFTSVIEKIEARNTYLHQFANSPALQMAASVATAAASSYAAVVPDVVPEHVVSPMADAIGLVSTVVGSYHNHPADILYSGFLTTLESVVKTPELMRLQSQLDGCMQNMGAVQSVMAEYADNLTNRWEAALGAVGMFERSIAAQNLAVLRMFPDYSDFDLPRGGKSVLKSLTKSAARRLTESEEILFDPKERDFYHKDTPGQRVKADQITVAASSLELFDEITLDELLSFESQLDEAQVFAMEHPVGKKIFRIIESWNQFIDFEDVVYYHARKLEKGKAPYIDSEMLKAPQNVSSHGRYNGVGKSCYYIAETKAGAVKEIRKHCGNTRPDIQVAGLVPVKGAKILDLSGERKGSCFLEHLRYTVDNDTGKIIRQYLLPNFVADCCKRLGIEGIKYKSTGYNCFVLWRDDYFAFAEGSREIVKQ